MNENRFFRACLILSEIFSVWYISSALLLYQTRLQETLTGFAHDIFVLYTRFFIEPIAFAAVQVICVPIAVGVLAAAVAVFAKNVSRGARVLFVLPPLIACVLGIIKIWTFPTADPDTEACAFASLDGVFCYAVWIVCGAVLQCRATDVQTS